MRCGVQQHRGLDDAIERWLGRRAEHRRRNLDSWDRGCKHERSERDRR